ncbi:hypothetical protein [Ovoidimarina sediminis]|nr:hypothetical protein [Rhodophyticola sp. MJ-SS7]MDU8943056.1 hypothetical protein [Rhodophyticola sp. MJ-SS7]
MSKTFKAFVVLGLVTLAAACAQQEEEVVIVEPVMEEPMSSKF